MRKPWQGILGESRIQKPLLRRIARSRLLRKLFKRRLTPVERRALWRRPEDEFAYVETYHANVINTFDLFKEAVLIKGKRILDLGCGQGALSCRYAEAGARMVVGCDRNNEGWPLRNARAYLEYKGLRQVVPLVQGDAVVLPFADATFDLVALNDVCDHIVGLSQALQECYRVLAPGGHVAITFIPWHHPGGFHLMDYIPIPYANLVFSERAVVETLVEMAAQDPAVAASISGLKRNPPPTTLDEVGITLSRVTIRQFQRMLDETDFNVRHFELVGFGRKSKNRLLAGMLDSLTRIPLVKELLTSRINCLLEKPAQ